VAPLTAAPPKTCRLLYYGPGGSGKRANLRQIMESIPPDHRLDLAVEDPDRQAGFLLHNGDQGDWQILIQTVDAGRERYLGAGNSQQVPFDGIVFVINSESARLDQSLSSLEALKTYLDTWGKDLMAVPVVLQYNRRDGREVLPVDRLESLLNPWGLLSFPACSLKGEGVKETLKAILGLTITHLLQMPGNSTATQPSTSATREFDNAPPVPGSQSYAERPDGTLDAGSEERIVVNPVAVPQQIDGEPMAGPPEAMEFAADGSRLSDDAHPPIVVPVRIPRRLLHKQGSARILLEIQVIDDDGILD